MTPRRIKGYGWKPQLPDHRDRQFTLAAPVSVPTSVDLRGLMPPVYDQGNLGSCTANMGAAMFQFCALKEAFSDHTVPSRLFLYYNERVMEGDPEADGGAQCRDALKCLATLGSIPETDWPYDISQFATKPHDQCYVDAVCEKAIEYVAVGEDVQSCKVVLASGFPIGFGFTVYESFESPHMARNGIMIMPAKGEQIIGGHAVVRAGYMDNAALPYHIPPHASGGYYIVRNSWGESWGDKGYFYMPYAADKFSSDFWVLKLVD
jgi:C1A family cysteine protease